LRTNPNFFFYLHAFTIALPFFYNTTPFLLQSAMQEESLFTYLTQYRVLVCCEHCCTVYRLAEYIKRYHSNTTITGRQLEAAPTSVFLDTRYTHASVLFHSCSPYSSKLQDSGPVRFPTSDKAEIWMCYSAHCVALLQRFVFRLCVWSRCLGLGLSS
jgi:hypothetical protein